MRLLPLLLAATMATAPVLVHGQNYYDGLVAYFDGDHETAAEIFLPLAEEGDDDAQFRIGLMYQNGEGVPQNFSEAAKWFRMAADQGNAGAQRSLDRMAAEQGDARAQRSLGWRYYYGKGVPQDYSEAAKWFRLAAEQGYAGAQYGLGVMYYNGEGVPQNFSEAAKWFRMAADQGNAGARYNLALMWENGEGVPQNYSEAARLYRLAADQGLTRAQNNLGLMYYNGEGVPQNFTNAYILFNLAAAQGNEKARKNRENSAEDLTPDQLAEAQRLSSEWELGDPLPLQGG